MANVLRKGNIRVSLSLNKETYKKYQTFCIKEGLIISKQVEKFMKKYNKSKKDRNVLDSILGK